VADLEGFNLQINVNQTQDLRSKIAEMFCFFRGVSFPLFEISESATASKAIILYQN
jgi:hypothetical protein